MTLIEVQALAIVGGLTLITFYVFGRLLRRIRAQGGKVQGHGFDLPELLMSIVLAGFFAAVVVRALVVPAEKMDPKMSLEQGMEGSQLFVVFTLSIIFFLRFRGLHLTTAFGLNRLPLPGVFTNALGLIAAAFPVVLFGLMSMHYALRENAQEQELVTLFKILARDADLGAVAQILFTGAVLAPICEEFLFRGLFYPVFKRHLGAIPSAVVTAALFAAVHVNLAALPSLFLLALCFTIAYEATGSLLVPIAMHAFFNAGQLGILYFVSTQPA